MSVKEELSKIIEKAESCPNCDNGGTLSEHSPHCDCHDRQTTCPVAVQCEFCYTNPNSKFNATDQILTLIESSLPEEKKEYYSPYSSSGTDLYNSAKQEGHNECLTMTRRGLGK